MRDAVAIVAPKYPNRTVQQDRLVYLADLAADNGCDALKLYATGDYTNVYQQQAWGGPYTNLADLIADPAYDTIFSDSRLVRFFINTWTFANGINNPWINTWTKAQDAAEESEMYDFACALLTRNDGKEYVIQNWEGDWALLGEFNPKASVRTDRTKRMAAYLRARKRAIERARNDVPSTTKIVFAVEVNRALDAGHRVHWLLRRVKPDAVSSSAYEIINTYGANIAATQANVLARLTRFAALVRFSLGTRVRLYVGEYGQPEFESGFTSLGQSAGAMMTALRSAAQSLGFTDCCFWQVTDNEEISPGNPRGYCMFNTSMALTVQGTTLVAVWGT